MWRLSQTDLDQIKRLLVLTLNANIQAVDGVHTTNCALTNFSALIVEKFGQSEVDTLNDALILVATAIKREGERAVRLKKQALALMNTINDELTGDEYDRADDTEIN